jgi:hypothetical protein
MATLATISLRKTTPRRHSSAVETAHVKAQVHFLEVAVERDRHALHPRVFEKQTDDAEVALPL